MKGHRGRFLNIELDWAFILLLVFICIWYFTVFCAWSTTFFTHLTRAHEVCASTSVVFNAHCSLEQLEMFLPFKTNLQMNIYFFKCRSAAQHRCREWTHRAGTGRKEACKPCCKDNLCLPWSRLLLLPLCSGVKRVPLLLWNSKTFVPIKVTLY